MRKILIITALLLASLAVNAQIYVSRDNGNVSASVTKKKVTVEDRQVRKGFSVGVTMVASYGLMSGKDSYWRNYGFTLGPWIDAGYNINSHFYLGASLGLQKLNWNSASIVDTCWLDLVAGPRFYFFDREDTPFIDARMGICAYNPSTYGRYEIGVGYLIKNHFEVTFGIEDALLEISRFRVAGLFLRAGWRFL